MKTAVIYARYSCDNQTEQSIEGQLRVCEQYAKNNDIVILGTYIDRAMTGTNDNRPDFQRMLKDSYKKAFDYVLVYKLDRFSRNKYESVIHKKTLKENGVKVLSAMENIPDTPEGIILESLLEGMNQYYSAELAQKVKRGMFESRMKGNFTGGIVPYGYRVENKKIIIKEDEAEVLRYIFKHYAYGEMVVDIIKFLTEQKIYYHGKPFIHNDIYKLLQNEKYTGVYRLGGHVFENLFPQIIDKDIYKRAEHRRELNRHGKYSETYQYLLRQKVHCGYCGEFMGAESGRGYGGVLTKYYKCRSRKRYGAGCPKESIRKEVLEDFVVSILTSVLEDKKNYEAMIDAIMRVQDENQFNGDQIANLNKNLKKTETQLNNLLSAIEMGVVNQTTNARMKELEKEIETIKTEIIIEENKHEEKLTREQVKEYFKKAFEFESVMLINYLVDDIIMYNDKVEIIFNSPIQKSPNDKGFSFMQRFTSIRIAGNFGGKTVTRDLVVDCKI